MTTSITRLQFRYSGKLADLGEADRRRLFDRTGTREPAIADVVAKIIERVRTDGDSALRQLARELDSVELEALEVPSARIEAAYARVSPALRSAMRRSAANLERVHSAFVPAASEIEVEPGLIVGRRPDPLDRVGVYAPGGSASYASSVLMGAVPARAAGVREVVVCCPPAADGFPSDIVLAAARIAGVDRVFSLGGAGAIAAMAFGTETVPRVDRIVGPGNAYVAEAKLQLTGSVAIDSPAGPSELLIIADEGASAECVAREAIAQAEHDSRAVILVLALGPETASRIREAIAMAVETAPRRDIIIQSFAGNGGVLDAGDIATAIDASNRFAPEHLLIATRDPGAVLPRVRNAGTVFLGQTTSVVFGDYITGANHVLPTGGLARSYSGLSTLDYFRWTTYQRASAQAAASLAGDAAIFAESEGLPSHAAAARAAEAKR
ncbi:MAG TPA: histidinol dehydrogenase [Gemmatimonadaceae bacterium]